MLTCWSISFVLSCTFSIFKVLTYSTLIRTLYGGAKYHHFLLFVDTCFKITLHQNIKLNTDLHHRKIMSNRTHKTLNFPRTKEHSALAGTTTMVSFLSQPRPQGYHLLAHSGYDTYVNNAAGCIIRIGGRFFSFWGERKRRGQRKPRYLNRRQQI